VSHPGKRPPVSRPTVVRALAFALLTLAGAPAAVQGQPCFPGCDPMNPTGDCCPVAVVDAPCDAFFACQETNRTGVGACVERFCMGRGALGQCARALECSRQCTANNTINCSKDLRSSLQTEGACSIGRGTARRTCNGCFPEQQQPLVCSEQFADTSGSTCQKQCIRAQPWIKECYAKCDDRCAKDRCAIAVCRRVCRNSICEILQNTCDLEGAVPGNAIQKKLQEAYIRCCDKSGECDVDSGDDITCESTSTTSTSTSSSSTRQTTTSTVRGTTTSTTLSSS